MYLIRTRFFSVFFLLLFISCNDTGIEKPAAVVRRDTSITNGTSRNPYASVDISPIDISYFPADYPIQKMTGATNKLPVARIIYGRPHRQGRKIFGELLKFGEPWRLGANEATELELFQPVTIQGKSVPRGRYILYCIINENSWTINFNSNLFSWGLKPDTTKNLYSFQTPVVHANQSIEYFTMVFEKASENGANMLITWDDVIVRLPLKY